jgi:undecaprenyl-diphosphatase
MNVVQAIILGIVQGLTEFLPVSSSGHLVLVNYYLGWGEHLPLYVDIATNTGTFLAVLVALRTDVWMALRGFVGGLFGGSAGRRTEGWRLALLVIVGSVPTAMIGLALRGVFESLNAPVPVSLALAVTGVILWTAPRPGIDRTETAKTTAHQLSFRDAVLAGIAQGIAVVPGISRSGSTIAALLHLGAAGPLAARLSFLLYLVASAGVALLGFGEVTGSDLELAPLVAMTIASFLTGWGAILALFSVLRQGQFKWFAPYLWVIAAITLVHTFAT